MLNKKNLNTNDAPMWTVITYLFTVHATDNKIFLYCILLFIDVLDFVFKPWKGMKNIHLKLLTFENDPEANF